MSRQVVTKEFVAQERQRAAPASAITGTRDTSKADDYTSKVVKLIPAELVALYLFLSGVIVAGRPHEADRGPLLIFVFVVLLLLTVPYLSRVAKVKSGIQIVVSTLAFVIWIFSLGGPFVFLLPKIGLEYDPLWGALLLPIYTFVTPIFDSTYTEAPAEAGR